MFFATFPGRIHGIHTFPSRIFRVVFVAAVLVVLAGPLAILPSMAPAAEPASQKPVAVPENYGDAMRWYERAAKAGNARAQFYLGMLYEQGLRGKQNDKSDQKAAITWFAKAAGQGHRQAQLKLGLFYYQGIGIERNYKEAAHWFEKAAAQSSTQATYNLALMLVRGLGVDKDAARAANLFEKVARRGMTEAALHLAVLYGQEDRKGDKKPDNLKQDKVLALTWLEWALGKGLKPDPAFHEKLAGSMTKTEIAKARALALERLKN